VPGIDPGSIDLTVERNVLTVHAERTRPDPQAERIAAEVSHGLFSRQLFLGDSLDVDHLTADYTDGVLTLRLPVAERAKPRRIEVQHTGGTRSVEAATSSSSRRPTRALPPRAGRRRRPHLSMGELPCRLAP
jgi:HSP20 family protein